MKQAQFKKLETTLYKRGYHKYIQHWNHEDYVIGKGFHRVDNQWDDDRSAYQILLSIYDYSMRRDLWDRLPVDYRNRVGIEIRFGISRIIDERIDMIMDWHEDTAIEDVEAQAESFYQWVCKEYPKPRRI
jgi:hypothetical protein